MSWTPVAPPWADIFSCAGISSDATELFAKNFEAHNVQLEHINLLTPDDFASLGVTRIGDRLSIVSAVQTFLSEYSTTGSLDSSSCNASPGMSASPSLPIYLSPPGWSESPRSASYSEDDLAMRLSEPRKVSTTMGPPTVESSEIFYYESIGSGGHAEVFRGRCRGKEVAVKVLKDSEIATDFLGEVAIMASVNHPNIALFMGACIGKDGKMRILSEYLPGGSVADLLDSEGDSLAMHRRLMILYQVCEGMSWLHSLTPCPILHLDLKPQNLLLDNHGTVKVSDFGIAQFMSKDSGQCKVRGSLPYMSPERLLSSEVSPAADVYSFGILAWEIITGELPFAEIARLYDRVDLEEFFAFFRQLVAEDASRPPLELIESKLMASTVSLCWAPDPKDRLSFNHLRRRLKSAVLRNSISNDAARKFWRQHWASRGKFGQKVACDDVFCALRWHKHEYAATLRSILRRLLGKIVSMQSFGQFSATFGPPDEELPYRVHLLCMHPAFFGSVPSSVAKSCLTSRVPGTYLVRIVTPVASDQGSATQDWDAIARGYNFASAAASANSPGSSPSSPSGLRNSVGEVMPFFGAAAAISSPGGLTSTASSLTAPSSPMSGRSSGTSTKRGSAILMPEIIESPDGAGPGAGGSGGSGASVGVLRSSSGKRGSNGPASSRSSIASSGRHPALTSSTAELGDSGGVEPYPVVVAYVTEDGNVAQEQLPVPLTELHDFDAETLLGYLPGRPLATACPGSPFRCNRAEREWSSIKSRSARI